MKLGLGHESDKRAHDETRYGNPGTMTNHKTWTRENAVALLVNPVPPVYHIVIFLRRFMIDYMCDGFSLADKWRPGRN